MLSSLSQKSITGKNNTEVDLRKKARQEIMNQFSEIYNVKNYKDSDINDSFISKIITDQKSKPVTINSGSKSHSMGYIVFKDKLYVCNKGSGARDKVIVHSKDPQKTFKARAIESYCLKNDDSDKDLLKKLLKSTKFDKAKDVYTEIENSLKKAQNTPFNSNPKQTTQRLGNCWLMSPITTIYALSILHFEESLSTLSKKDKDKLNKIYRVKSKTNPDNELAAKLGRSFYKDHLAKKHMLSEMANEMDKHQWNKLVVEFAINSGISPDKMRRLKNAHD